MTIDGLPRFAKAKLAMTMFMINMTSPIPEMIPARIALKMMIEILININFDKILIRKIEKIITCIKT